MSTTCGAISNKHSRLLIDDVTGTVLFFHAHPDDEAIFTGGTIVRLRERGVRSSVLFATRGERGESPAGSLSGDVGVIRETETEQAARTLGLTSFDFLDYEDSGMAGAHDARSAKAFWSADPVRAADEVAAVAERVGATTLVTYDEWGIYGHPDHVKVHDVGVRAAALLGIATIYEATVDREYLHFVETHLVVEAGVGERAAEYGPGRLGLAAAPIGMPTVAITTTVDVRAVLDTKREAMAAHASQIPETASALQLPASAFAAVYGYEWFVRRGAHGVLDDLG
jgi:LmbE family N-acetylglucosaminyl deacetylase